MKINRTLIALMIWTILTGTTISKLIGFNNLTFYKFSVLYIGCFILSYQLGGAK
jgi:hypothetical protein